MNLWKKLFKITEEKTPATLPTVPTVPTVPEEKVSKKKTGKWTIKVKNKTDILKGEDFVVFMQPDLKQIFSDPDPPPCFELSEKVKAYWNRTDLEMKRTLLAVAYLEHVDFNTVEATIDLIDGLNSFLIRLSLIELLRHPYEKVSRAAAKAVWKREAHDFCSASVKILRDEIHGKAHAMMDKTDAIIAVELLEELSPDETAKEQIQHLIETEIIIEERIKEVNVSAVKFVDKEVKGRYTYEVYSSKNMITARSFLKNKIVDKPCYYIEVETPEGKIGKDIEGIYKL